jgi:hypothetical protein
MNQEPVLATRRLAPGDGYRVPRLLTIYGGLHYIKGNSKPYFSITTWSHRLGFRGQCQSGGADHDTIEKLWPGKFSDLIALHLHDIDGAPMSAEANGWYDLAGALGGMDERYHRGNSKMNMPCEAPPGKPWQTTESREPTRIECLEMFADANMLDILTARAFTEKIAFCTPRFARQMWRDYLETLRPMWQEKANTCIARHSLVVYGDKWPRENAA